MRVFQSIGKRFNRNRNGKKKHDNASVADFADKQSLQMALTGRRPSATPSVSSSSMDDPSVSSFSDNDVDLPPVEWTLPLVDTETTEPQTMEEEMARLEVLNSYFLLDSQGEVEFDRITRLGSKMFDVPICLISLVDLGRQWFLSKVGLDAAETPRKHAFCAHVILNKYKMLVVPDATKDFRFKDNPLVTDGLKIRFYAGAALVSPEGYKLGTFCIISPHVRPQGLSASEQEMLHEMAGMVVSTMVARRNRLLKQEYEHKFHQLARTFLDTSQNLGQAKTNMDQVIARHSWGMEKAELEAMNSAANILDVQSKMCTATMRNVLQDTPLSIKYNQKSERNLMASNQADENEMDDEFFDDPTAMQDKIKDPTTDVQKLFDNINAIAGNFPRQDDVTVEVDKTVPKEIGIDDLLLFRAILNMLTHCMGASQEGEKSGVRVRRMKKEENTLLVQCLAGGNPISRQAAKDLFENKDSLLSPVASIVRSMGGHFGMYEAKWDTRNSNDPVKSIFWFQVPYHALKSAKKLNRSLVKTHPKLDKAALKALVAGSGDGKTKMDPFQSALLASGCGRVPVR